MYRIASPSSSPKASPPAEAQPGVLAAIEWVAGGLSGPSPQARELIAAVNAGLVRLGDPWSVTPRGWAALQRHRGRAG